MRLASLSTDSRRDVDYRLLDSRLKQLMTKPAMVGLAVGVVENGRITFLQGYGETLAGSGDPVTPETVFRWASVSKGVAATMVAKLAEQGKINLNAPVANYAPDLKLPNGNERIATVGDLLSHRLGLYRDAYANKLEEGQDPSFLRLQPCAAQCGLPAGHLLGLSKRRLRRVERDGLAHHPHAVRAGGQTLSVRSDRYVERQRVDGGPAGQPQLGETA